MAQVVFVHICSDYQVEYQALNIFTSLCYCENKPRCARVFVLLIIKEMLPRDTSASRPKSTRQVERLSNIINKLNATRTLHVTCLRLL